MPLAPLPIDAVLPELCAALSTRGVAVLVAPPGSGKTTRVPPALLDAGLAGSGRVLVLQPRRVAARLAARRIAQERDCAIGEEIGYQVRFEDRTGPNTRIEVLTEGLLNRRIQADPFLEQAGLVILDELHERSLHTDLALALLRELRANARPELRILAMSATLDPGPVQAFLGDARGPAPLIRAEGRTFPIELDYLPRSSDLPLWEQTAAAIRQVHDPALGHTLVFLPGVREIERTAELLALRPPPGDPPIIPLHGSLPPEAQDRALAPGGPARVVLATNLAETSVTLAGVRTVVDTGLARVAVHDPALGLDRLELQPIARDSADQRAGRAGRTAPGRCLRLWTESQELLRAPRSTPALVREDLTEATLTLLDLGEDPRTFPWFEPPPPALIDAALALLARLGAWDGKGITALGRSLAALPLHPRMGRLVLEGHREGCLPEVAAAAALLGERDPWPDRPDLDLLDRVALLDRPSPQDRGSARNGALAACWAVRDQLVAQARRLGPGGPRPAQLEDTVLLCLLHSFPERLALRREPTGPRLRLASGLGAVLDPPEQVPGTTLLLAVHLQAVPRGQRGDHKVRLAAPVPPGLLPTQKRRALTFDPQTERVSFQELTEVGGLVLDTRNVSDARPEPADVADCLRAAIRATPERALNLESLQGLHHRLRLLARVAPELGLPDSADLGWENLLDQICHGRRSFEETRAVDLGELALQSLEYKQRETITREAPLQVRGPTGAQLPLSYEPELDHPNLSAKIQQVFGMQDTPRIALGRLPVRLVLLAPNQRPAAITQDLRTFWRDVYPEVRKELRGRYPRHAWPENPLEALPEDRPKRRPT